MAQINLIPRDLAPRPAIIKTSGIVKQIITVGFVIFIVSGILAAALYYYYARQLKASRAKVSELSASVKALQVTEQRLLLVRDRLEKAKLVLGKETSMDELEAAGTLFLLLPSESSISSAEFSVGETKMAIQAPTTKVFTSVLSTLTTSGIYEGIDMTSFTFAPQTGFNMVFKLIK